MKANVVFVLLAGCLLVMAAWLVHVPNPAQAADEVPEKYRETVKKGLEYLARHQHEDGHWEGDGGKHPVAMTGLVGLAFLMDRGLGPGYGGKVRASKYADKIRKAMDWLMDKSQARRDGLIYSDHPSETGRYMEGHGLAALFLIGAHYENEPVRFKRINDTIERAINYILKAQTNRGGWYHTSKAEGHDFDDYLASVIQLQALLAAQNAGIFPAHEVVPDAQEYLRVSLAKKDAAAPGKHLGRSMESAAAIACRYSPSARRVKDEQSEKWFQQCLKSIPVGRDMRFGRDELTHYYYAQAAYLVGDYYGTGRDVWKNYRMAMFDHLQNTQNKNGSWPAANGIGVGPVYATALWCTVLQLDRNSHPAAQKLRDVE